MEVLLKSISRSLAKADCALIFAFSGAGIKNVSPAFVKQTGWVSAAPGAADVKGKKEEMVLLYGPAGAVIPRVLVCGLGKTEEFTLDVFRSAVGKATRALRQLGIKSMALPVEALEAPAKKLKVKAAGLLKEMIFSSLVSLYKSEAWQSARPEDDDLTGKPEKLFLLHIEAKSPAEMAQAVTEARAEAAGVLYARQLVNTPANIATPDYLAKEAKSLAKKYGFTCKVLDEKEIQKQGMGALWAIGKGSENPPRFIILEHRPKGKTLKDPVVFVGKGISFDTGGISLKPPAKMHEMKGDMAGAAAVLGFFEALGNTPGKDDVPHLVGIVSSAENMPDGSAVRPGDVLTTLSGKTVEIQNTDAEGRMVLCDALTYAQKHWKPRALFDIATLTGACVVALGDFAAGVFTDDKKLRALVMDAAETTGDLFWPMPMWDSYDKNLTSNVADFSNMGPREGGAINAALFLRRFIEKGTPWAHLDIAGPGYVVQPSALSVPGGTGVGVRLFWELVRKLY